MRRTADVIQEAAEIHGVKLSETQLRDLVRYADDRQWSHNGYLVGGQGGKIADTVKHLDEKKMVRRASGMDDVSKRMIEMQKQSGGNCGIKPCKNCVMVDVDGTSAPYCQKLRIVY